MFEKVTKQNIIDVYELWEYQYEGGFGPFDKYHPDYDKFCDFNHADMFEYMLKQVKNAEEIILFGGSVL